MHPENPTEPTAEQNIIAPSAAAGQRLDAFVASCFSDYSRSRLQSWIREGYLTVDGQARKPRDKLVGGEQIMLILPPDVTGQTWEETWAGGAARFDAQAMDIDVVHTDTHYYVINKPADCVMHPAPGNRDGTLMNGLLHLEPALRSIPRAGIVHRLDKDTTGLCVVARTLKAHNHLVNQLQTRSMSRRYLAIVLGDDLPDSGTVVEPIGRHPKDRKRMAVTQSGKHAVTHFKVLERYRGCSLVDVKLETGRTHQIRVHMTHLGFPLLGDSVYRRRHVAQSVNFRLSTVLTAFTRQALHARQLGLINPETDELCVYDAEPPADLQTMLNGLRAGSVHDQ